MAKILVIDDDPDLVESLTMMLEGKGYEVEQAYGGIEGLQKAKEGAPDAIILDIMMPDKDGFEVCRELKGDPKFRAIPILLLTAVVSKFSTTRWTPRMAMESEAEDWVDKPVDAEEIVRRVEALLRK